MDKVTNFIKTYYQHAFRSELQIQIPTLFTLAQAALETGWGKKSEGNNLFGITADKNWKGKKLLVKTFEYHDTKNVKYPEIESITYDEEKKKYKYIVKRYFREYNDVAECFNDHNEFLLKSRYQKAFDHVDNSKKFATEVANAGYATGTKYAATLHNIIDRIEKIVDAETLELGNKIYAKVDTRLLNVRNAPDKDAKKVDRLKRGEKVQLLKKCGEWYQIKEKTGYVASRYLNAKNKVTAKSLNIREEPMGDIISGLNRGEEVTILETKAGWSKLLLVSEWIHGKYVELEKTKDEKTK